MKTLAEHLFGIEAGTTHRAHALDSDTDSGAYLARETARAVMDQDAPLFVCEADGQFLVSGEDTAVLINPDGEVSIRSKDNQGKVSDSNMNYDENELYEQPGLGREPRPRRRKPSPRVTAASKAYFEDDFEEDSFDEGESAMNVAKNALGVIKVMLPGAEKRIMQSAKKMKGGQAAAPVGMVRTVNFLRSAADAMNTIVQSGDEGLAQAALRGSTEKRLNMRNVVGTLAQAGVGGWAKKSRAYGQMVGALKESFDESLDESQPHAGAQYHRSKRNKLSDPRGPQSETNPRDYPTDTNYGHGNPRPQFREDISEQEWLQFWLDEVVENAYTPDMKPVIQAIDAAVEEEDFDTFDIEAARLAEMAGVLDEYKKMSGGARASMMKSRKKPKTGKQKVALKKRRLKYKKNKSKMLRASRKYRKKVGARMASDDNYDNLMEVDIPTHLGDPTGEPWHFPGPDPWWGDPRPIGPWIPRPFGPLISGGPFFGSGGPGGRSAGPLRQSDDNYSNLTEQPAGYGPDFKPLNQGSVGWGPPNGGNGGGNGGGEGLGRMAQVLAKLLRKGKVKEDYFAEQGGTGGAMPSGAPYNPPPKPEKDDWRPHLDIFAEITGTKEWDDPIGGGGGLGWKVGAALSLGDPKWWKPTVRVSYGDPWGTGDTDTRVTAGWTLWSN